jgi:shikimate kinase
MLVLLIGARAAGKTTIGRRIAELRSLPFVDLDDRVCARLGGGAVAEIWRRLGEAAWRRAEVEALREVAREGDAIVALGGGTPALPAAQRIIEERRQRGRMCVVYLRCAAPVLAARLRAEAGDRPSLTGRHPADEIEEVAARREPAYLALADASCDTTGADPEATAREVIELVWGDGRGRGESSGPR